VRHDRSSGTWVRSSRLMRATVQARTAATLGAGPPHGRAEPPRETLDYHATPAIIPRRPTIVEVECRPHSGFTRGVTLLAVFGLGVASLCLVTWRARGGYFPVRPAGARGVHARTQAPSSGALPDGHPGSTAALRPRSGPREFLTLGKQRSSPTGLILWRVHDPAKYMRTVFDRVGRVAARDISSPSWAEHSAGRRSRRSFPPPR